MPLSMFAIVIDTTPISEFFALPPDQIMYGLMVLFGWIPLVVVFLWGAKELWLYYRQNQWGTLNDKYMFLAVDIPRNNNVSMQMVENMFTYFGGAHGSFNLIEEYWIGVYQLGFSFEIVSIDGYTQFVIKTPPQFRNLTESAIYSCYPDAEITEINDYTEGIPTKYPDPDYDVWGAEFIYAKNHMLPFKTWPNFEHQASGGLGESVFKDPMSSLMDLYSSMRKGEQCWMQILVKPMGYEWVADADKQISKILGESLPTKKNIVEQFFSFILEVWNELARAVAGDFLTIGDGASEQKPADSFKMFNLKPKEKKQMEAIQMKASKLGFDCKIRFVYVAKKDLINKAKAVNGFVGYMKQFMDLDTNNIKPDMEKTATSTSYFFKSSRLNQRKTNIVGAYKARSASQGRLTKVMNIEELATLWHFPVEVIVKAPLIQKTPGRKSEPPMSLPFGEEVVNESFEASQGAENDIFTDFNGTGDESKSIRKSGSEDKISGSSVHEEDIFADTDNREDTGNSRQSEDKGPGAGAEPNKQAPDNLPFV